MESGFPWHKFRLRTLPLYGCIADYIIREQCKDNCCTIVVERRGISRKEEFFSGSTSNELVHMPENCSIWAVG